MTVDAIHRHIHLAVFEPLDTERVLVERRILDNRWLLKPFERIGHIAPVAVGIIQRPGVIRIVLFAGHKRLRFHIIGDGVDQLFSHGGGSRNEEGILLAYAQRIARST